MGLDLSCRRNVLEHVGCGGRSLSASGNTRAGLTARNGRYFQFQIGTRGKGTDSGKDRGNLGRGEGIEDREGQLENLNFVGLGGGARRNVIGQNVTRQ